MCGTRQIAFFSSFLPSNRVLNCHKTTQTHQPLYFQSNIVLCMLQIETEPLRRSPMNKYWGRRREYAEWGKLQVKLRKWMFLVKKKKKLLSVHAGWICWGEAPVEILQRPAFYFSWTFQRFAVCKCKGHNSFLVKASGLFNQKERRKKKSLLVLICIYGRKVLFKPSRWLADKLVITAEFNQLNEGKGILHRHIHI